MYVAYLFNLRQKEACPNNAYRGHINFHNFSSLTNISMLPWANKVKRLYFPITSRAQYSPGIASVLKLFSPKRNNYYWSPLFLGDLRHVLGSNIFYLTLTYVNWISENLTHSLEERYTSSWAIFSQHHHKVYAISMSINFTLCWRWNRWNVEHVTVLCPTCACIWI